MQVRIVTPGEVLPVLLEDTELRGPDTMPRISLVGGSWPFGTQVINAETRSLRHCFVHDVHDVQQDAWHFYNTPAADKVALEWYDVCSLNNGWYSPSDPIRPSGKHGHPLYGQNEELDPLRTFRACVFSGIATAGKLYAQANTVDGGNQYSKTANYLVEDCVFIGGTFLVGNFIASYRDAVNVTVRRCVFINCTVTIGYNGTPENITFEDNIVHGTLTIKGGAGITVRNNRIVTKPPYRDGGTLYDNGSGSVSTNWGWLSSYTNPVFEGNRLFTDGPQSAFNGRSRAQMRTGGGMVGDLHLQDAEVVRPLAETPAFTRRIDIPERNAAWLVVYNPSGAPTIPLDGYYRVRDVRRWHSSYVSNELVMSGEPDAPMNWPPEYGAPPIAPNMFPEFGIFRIETVTPEEIVTELEQRLFAVEAELAAIRQQIATEQAAHVAELAARDVQIVTLTDANAAKDAQIAALTAERDSAVAFRASAEPLVNANKANGDALAALFAPVG